MSDNTIEFPSVPGDDPEEQEQPAPASKEPIRLRRKAKPEVPIKRRLIFIGGGLLVAAAFVGLMLMQRASASQQEGAGAKNTGTELFAPSKNLSPADANMEFSAANQPKATAQSNGTASDGSRNAALAKWEHDFPFVAPPDYLKNGTAPPPSQPNGAAPNPQQPNGTPQNQNTGLGGFRNSFFSPNSNGNGNGNGTTTTSAGLMGAGEHSETDAEMYRRLEREARLAPSRVDVSKKGDGTLRANSLPGGGGPSYTPSVQGITPASLSMNAAASPVEQIRALGELAKGLVASQSGGGGSPAPTQALASRLAAAVPQTNTPSPSGSSSSSSSSGTSGVIQRMADHTMKTWRNTALSPYEIIAGTDIPCALKQEMDTEAPGVVECQVTKNIKNSYSLTQVMIPAGSTMIYTYKPATSGNAGISRVDAIATRIIFPDTSSMDLETLAAQDNKGEAGIAGKANNHYRAIISSAVLQTLVSTGSALLLNRSGGASGGGLGYYPSMSQAAESGAANSINEVGSQLTRRAMNIPVTIHVKAATVIHFELDKDIPFDGPYKDRKPLSAGSFAAQ